jgi:hypothetical protein
MTFKYNGMILTDGFLMGRGDGTHWRVFYKKWYRLGLRLKWITTPVWKRNSATVHGHPVYLFAEENPLLESRIFG